MPPRYAYWTILVDDTPTAFRAREADELLPTLNQLKRKSADVVMKWFARGRLWDSPEAERAAQRQPTVTERRGNEWRPGGKHEDPRARFAKNKKRDAPRPGAARPDRPWKSKPPGSASSGSASPADRPWTKKPAAAADTKRPWRDRPAAAAGAKRPWGDKPASGAPRVNRPWSKKAPPKREPPDRG
jgi:hypothetical protein